VAGLYACILLHEFGHALAARWCDGEADHIVLWPLGGLAFVRPAWNPTAHLITTVAGPLVTLVLWLAFWGATWLQAHVFADVIHSAPYVFWFCGEMMILNLWLLLFNLIPAFPMDGGRILRDTLWHWMSAETATKIAVTVSQVLAITAIGFAIYSQNYWLIFLAIFILLQAANERQIVAFESHGAYEFSIRERLRRGRRQRAFFSAVRERQSQEAVAAFHHCAACGRTEHDSADLDFRVCTDCSDGQEYCQEHLDTHRHV
jgi:Zn-dependent protease